MTDDTELFLKNGILEAAMQAARLKVFNSLIEYNDNGKPYSSIYSEHDAAPLFEYYRDKAVYEAVALLRWQTREDPQMEE